MNKELQSLLTDLEKFIYQSEKDKFTLDVHQVHLILDHIANQGEKIERLNNIINELEKWLVESIEKHTEDYLDWKYDKNVYLSGSEKLQNVFDKLQELKGKNND